MDEVYEFDTGKNDWNTFRVGVEDGRIVVRDETGHIEFEDGDVDELVKGIDQARRHLREEERSPTKKDGASRALEEESDGPDERFERDMSTGPAPLEE